MNEIFQDQSVKLYEYNFPKPCLDDIFLAHHQALGAHWHIMNGPPYPLSRKLSTGKRLKSAAKGVDGNKKKSLRDKIHDHKVKKKRKASLEKARATRAKNIKMKTLEKQKQEQATKTKDDIIKNKDINGMLKNVDKFTNQEINDMLTRLDTERRLRAKVVELQKANESKYVKVKNIVKDSTKRATKSMISTVAENALKMGTKELAKKILAGNNPEYQKLIEQLFREKKK